MAIGRAQAIQLYVGGAIPFPGEFPEVGTIALRMDGIEFTSCNPIQTAPLIVVKYNTSPRRSVTRYFLPDDAVALCSGIPADGNANNATWRIGPEVLQFLQRQVDPIEGILYVIETGQTVTKFEEGHTAAGSSFVTETPHAFGPGGNPQCE